ncbi:MAG: arabinose efflux permease family protein [Planctomycetaceae bacterium]|nr:arabinose efflux permease family protein [Planctomycetaceae bacterium]
MSSVRALVCLSLLHCIVDTYAMLVEPLWPRLSSELRLTPWSQWLLLTVAMLAVNFSQPVFGLLRDRWHIPAIVWIGPLVGVICLPLLGVLPHVGALCAVLTLGLVGIGAFHPEAVTMAGTVLEGKRTRGISILLLGGTLGLGLGPLIGGYCVQAWGLRSLALLILPGIVLVVLLELGSRAGSKRREQPADSQRVRLIPFLREHGQMAGLLLLVSTCRVLPAVGIPKAVAFTLANQGVDVGAIGLTQSVFLSAGSLGMLYLAGKFVHGTERRHLILDPLVAFPLVVGLGIWHGNYYVTVGLLMLAGLVLNGTTAAVISYAHQLFPNNTGIASSLTMGFAWGLGGIVVAILTAVANQAQHPEWLYWTFLPSLLVSSLLAMLLPRIDR